MVKRNYFILLLLFLTGSILGSTQLLLAQSQDTEVSDLADGEMIYPKIRLTIDGGLGYVVGSTKTSEAEMKDMGISDQEAKRYYDELKWGQQAGASVHYMLFANTGIGIDYNIFTTNSQVMVLLMTGDQTSYLYGSLSEKIYTNYLGISMLQEQSLTDRLNVYGEISAGMALYRNESQVVVAPVLITSNAPAFKGEFGIGYQFYRHLSVNLGVSYLVSTLQKIKLTDGKKHTEMELEGDSKENLSRLNISAGVQFNF